MKKRITIKSNFHDTKTTVLAEQIDDGLFRISQRQYNDAVKRICVSGCSCPKSADGYSIEEWTRDGMEMIYDLEAN